MAKANRQKYNFLVALLDQLNDAGDAADEAYDHFKRLVRLLVHDDWKELNERIDGIEQWLAHLESAVEELDHRRLTGVGEDYQQDDDGDDDDDVGWDEPEMVSPRQPDRRVPGAVAEPSDGPDNRRSRVSAPTKERISRGQR